VEGVGDLRIMQTSAPAFARSGVSSCGLMLLADKSRAIIGSINLTPGSSDSRREAAIRVE
jgi:hypothetical protein